MTKSPALDLNTRRAAPRRTRLDGPTPGSSSLGSMTLWVVLPALASALSAVVDSLNGGRARPSRGRGRARADSIGDRRAGATIRPHRPASPGKRGGVSDGRGREPLRRCPNQGLRTDPGPEGRSRRLATAFSRNYLCLAAYRLMEALIVFGVCAGLDYVAHQPVTEWRRRQRP
jgi:hypothetical protein